MSEQSAAIGARLQIEMSSHRPALSGATPAHYWAGRTMRVMVTLISLWDITVTFDRYLHLPRRLLHAWLAH